MKITVVRSPLQNGTFIVYGTQQPKKVASMITLGFLGYEPLGRIDSGKVDAMVTHQNENEKCQGLWNEMTMEMAPERLRKENDKLRV